ncbi:hypothetical protein ANN_13655 [Periplaneta americana]|uniref:Uncharacterized protein n=1 Tax=Periplaneta americana TaxID=6978 RepID=A0ABQ8TK02_PERAM|nr:hypothetical protein ANN_13655 [Periplaneta americana]
MILTYRETECNSRIAELLYSERFPRNSIPNPRTYFISVCQPVLRDTDRVLPEFRSRDTQEIRNNSGVFTRCVMRHIWFRRLQQARKVWKIMVPALNVVFEDCILSDVRWKLTYLIYGRYPNTVVVVDYYHHHHHHHHHQWLYNSLLSLGFLKDSSPAIAIQSYHPPISHPNSSGITIHSINPSRSRPSFPSCPIRLC